MQLEKEIQENELVNYSNATKDICSVKECGTARIDVIENSSSNTLSQPIKKSVVTRTSNFIDINSNDVLETGLPLLKNNVCFKKSEPIQINIKSNEGQSNLTNDEAKICRNDVSKDSFNCSEGIGSKITLAKKSSSNNDGKNCLLSKNDGITKPISVKAVSKEVKLSIDIINDEGKNSLWSDSLPTKQKCHHSIHDTDGNRHVIVGNLDDVHLRNKQTSEVTAEENDVFIPEKISMKNDSDPKKTSDYKTVKQVVEEEIKLKTGVINPRFRRSSENASSNSTLKKPNSHLLGVRGILKCRGRSYSESHVGSLEDCLGEDILLKYATIEEAVVSEYGCLEQLGEEFGWDYDEDESSSSPPKHVTFNEVETKHLFQSKCSIVQQGCKDSKKERSRRMKEDRRKKRLAKRQNSNGSTNSESTDDSNVFASQNYTSGEETTDESDCGCSTTGGESSFLFYKMRNSDCVKYLTPWIHDFRKDNKFFKVGF